MPVSKNHRVLERMELENSGDGLLQVSVDAAFKMPARCNFMVQSRAVNPCRENISSTRRDHYRISLITKGSGTITLGNRSYRITPPAIAFINPFEMKTWEPDEADGQQDGYYCVFNEDLFELQRHSRDEVLQHPMFQLGAQAVLPLTETQSVHLLHIFRQLMREYNDTTSAYKQEAIIIHLLLLLLETKRICATVNGQQRTLTTAQQLAQRFTDTLEKQFPIASVKEQVQLKTAREFAQLLNVHPNHLNATVKQVTGRTTSEQIRERILLEAKLLLLHTDWHIAEIAWCLGFEEPANFTHFFKSQTGQTPHIFRTV